MNNNYLKLIDQAHKLQLANKLQEAKVIYKKLLGVCFDNMYLFFYYAQLHVSLKDYETAIKYYLKALELDKNNFDIIFNLSLAYKSNKQIDVAIEYGLKAFDIKFDDYKNLLNLANLYAEKDDIDSQFNYLSRAAFVSNKPELFFSCGLLAKKAENYDLAIELFQKVLELDNNNTDSMIQIAFIYIKYDKKVAIELFEDLYNNGVYEKSVLTCLSILHWEFNNHEKSLVYSEKLYELFPDDLNSISMLAFSYHNNNLFDKSLYFSEKLYNISPDNFANNLLYAVNLSINNQQEKAIQLLKEHSNNPLAQKEYFSILLSKKEFDKVRDLYFEYYSKLTDNVSINEALKDSFYQNNYFENYKFTEEEFINSFDYTKSYDFHNRNIFNEKQWKQENIDNKRLLVFNPHGLGDFIMSARYLSDVQKKVKSLSFVINEKFHSLFKFNFPNSIFYSENQKIEDNSCDYATPAMCLIYNLNKNLYDIPRSEGYLKVDDTLVKDKSKILNLNSQKLNIGIYWQGNSTILKNRSIKLKYFLPIINDSSINVYSFQMSDIDKESDDLKKQLNIFDLQPYIKDFMDTAAFLKNIDVLVTIDTSIAHLAGALGVKTYLLLPVCTEWRWFEDTETTPWYDSVKIFKQTINDNWETLLVRVHEQLKKDYESKI